MNASSETLTRYSRYFDVLLRTQWVSGNKTIVRQCIEMLALLLLCRLGPGYYIQGRMFQKDFSLSDVLGFMSYGEYARRLRRLNPPYYRRCSQNKAVEKALLTTYGIPTPEFLGCFRLYNGVTTDGKPLRSASDLLALMAQLPIGSRICFKPVEGWGGRGFSAVEILDGDRIENLGTREVQSAEDFAGNIEFIAGDGMVVERYISQALDYAEFNASSVNTVRVLIRQMTGGEKRIIGAFLRIGRKGSLVDNGEAGGIIVPIDLATGRMQRGMSTREYGVYYDKHPDSGTALKGSLLPRFHEALECTRAALDVYPRIAFAGSDIAFTESGPVVIEMNVEPGYIDFALIRVPSRAMLE